MKCNGEALRARRLMQEMTVEKLSQQSGVAPASIRNAENGRTSLTLGSARSLACALGCKMSDFMVPYNR